MHSSTNFNDEQQQQQQQAATESTTLASASLSVVSHELNETNNSDRLKQRANSHSNGLTSTTVGLGSSTNNASPSNSNGHDERSSNGSSHCRFLCSSTQTVLIGSFYPFNNGTHNPSRTFTNSQKEILRLVGQHLQSVGLR
jgi:hypothetical protein